MTDTLLDVSPPSEPAAAGDAEERELSPAELAAGAIPAVRDKTSVDLKPIYTADTPASPIRPRV